jgi:hypothetical protein
MGIKNYLSRNDKFAVRMSVALRPTSNLTRTFIQKDRGLDDEQKKLFEDQDNIELGDTTNHSLIAPGSERRKSRCS